MAAVGFGSYIPSCAKSNRILSVGAEVLGNPEGGYHGHLDRSDRL